MLGSVLLPSNPPSLRRNTYTATVTPPLPPRRNSLSTSPSAVTAAKAVPLTIKSITLSGAMESRYNRPSSPRGRYANPARSSTGTFADPYYDPAYYGRPTSPRSSADRVSGSHYTSSYYTPSTSSASRTSNIKYDAYTGRPRRSTNEHMSSRPNVSSLTNTSIPIRTPYSPHSEALRPSSPLAPSYDKRGDAYITQPARREHKKVYSVDDTSRSTRLVAEKDIESLRLRDSVDRSYSLTSGGRSYGSHNSKPPPRLTDLNDDGYSYTDPASMYRDTEPAWRRPRSGSLERSSRPTSMIADRPARSSARDLGPPPSTRGFDKINSGIPRSHGSSHGRSSSIERSREVPKYDLYSDVAPKRTSSTRQRPTSIHQEPREQHRREKFHDDYDRRDRDIENRRVNTVDRFEDPHVSSRGFGIAPGLPSPLDRQPLHPDGGRVRPQEASNQYYQPDRADVRMPDPRTSRERDFAPTHDSHEKRSREREGSGSGFVPAAAGAAAGVAATLGAAGYMKSRDKERDSDRESSAERERERRREYDERDRRDRHEDRREKIPDERRDDRRAKASEPLPPRPQPLAVAAAPPPPPPPSVPGAYPPPPPETDRRPRDRYFEDDERDAKERSSKKAPSSEGSGDERPRHYVERDAELKKDSASSEPALDPDEEYRRRIQQEAERSNRASRNHDSDSDRDRDRRRRRDDRDRSRSRNREDRARGSPPSSSRYDERSGSIYDSTIVQEPEDLSRALEPANKSVQIVTPPKEAPQAPKGILRKPTEKFPEDPEPIREGVAPHKDAMKGKDIPVGARWTRIDRRLVNPEALEQAKERFEERMDCVIVLRVLTKEEIQKLADRTKKIREIREDEYDRRERDERDRDDRDRRGHRSSRDDKDDRESRDDEDRDRDRDRRRRSRRHEDERDSDFDDLDRERDKSRKLEIEPAR
ncbi:hypothetical protein ACN47E_008552 [Coniothyrium glycines]